jgi:hypothetical protein
MRAPLTARQVWSSLPRVARALALLVLLEAGAWVAGTAVVAGLVSAVGLGRSS